MARSVALLLLAAVAAGCASSTATPGSPAPAPPLSPHDTADLPPLPDPPVEGRHFAVYRGDGTPATLDGLLDGLDSADVVLVGEEHDDRIGHRIELALLEGAYRRHGEEEERSLVLSLEMFERDVQLVVDEYLGDLITEEHFLASARPWRNYQEAYRPLVEFAKVHDLAVVAANAPRRYVNLASRRGRSSLRDLSPEALETLAPLPYPEASATYRAQWDSVMGDAARHMSGSVLDGQTLWDATMAYSVARTLEARPGALVLHLAGGFHVESGTGIPEDLGRYRPGTRTLSVAIRPVEDPAAFDPSEHAGRGDFVILSDGSYRGGGGR